MVADPDGPALGLYRSLGFMVEETQLQAELTAAQADAIWAAWGAAGALPLPGFAAARAAE